MRTNKIKNPKVIKELQRLCKERKGLLPPEEVVEKARPVSSPLHNEFEWDNKKCGDEHRLWQARQLLSRVYVDIIDANGDNREVQVFVSLTSDRRAGGYRQMIDVLSDKDLRNQLLRDALADMRLFTERYKSLRELALVFSSIKKVSKKLKVI